METTLDSIQPSDMAGSDMSYLYGRDPSILAYSQRPVPTSKQNLLSLYEDEELDYPESAESTGASDLCLQTLKVYLRIKPLPHGLKLNTDEMESYQITNSTTLVTKLPSFDYTFNSLKGQKSSEMILRRFTFSQTFGPETTQLQIFEEIIQQKMIDFLAGRNCTLMTYGTTNSGKSYTLQGTTTSPGIIPRGLEFVFSNINPRPAPCYKPCDYRNIISLNAIERAQEIEAKNKLLTFASIDKHQYINAYRQMQKLLQEESPIRPSQAYDAHYSVWVSFAEIYNENIYDLLSNDCQKRRPALKLGTDRYGRSFIKGLKTICVNSGSEAYQVLMAGQYNLKVAATALNARSSRSHCIFTIKLLKYYTENSPDFVELSTFAFCDLAGSERLKKTLNVGDRLKEAQNINTSLLVLGRCLKSIYEGQSIRQREEHVGPFRESKLTRLFQRALSGKEQIALIVNINPVPNLYAETQNVLNFSAIAKKIIIKPKKMHPKISNSRFSLIVSQTAKSTTDWDRTELTRVTEQTGTEMTEENVLLQHEDYEDLIGENKNLKKEIGALKAAMLNKDLQIRKELADMYTAMIKQVETDWKNRMRDVEEEQEDHLQWTVNRVETFYKDKINELTSRKRRRSSDYFDRDECPDVEDLQMENENLHSKIHSLKKTIQNLRSDNKTVLTEKNQISFEYALANEELKSLKKLLASAQEDLFKDEESLTYVDELRNELTTKHQRIKHLKEFLNEAKEEFIGITSHMSTLEEHLKKRDESLVQYEERVADLEELLEQTNICLAEKSKQTEWLEDKINLQSNMLVELEERHTIEEAKLMNRVQLLTDEIATHKTSISNDKTVVGSSVNDVEIKKEKLLDPDDEVSLQLPHTVSNRVVIKTNDDESLGLPSTSFENDCESEAFLQIRKISLISNVAASTNENETSGNKFRKSSSEVESLKATLNSTKDQLELIKKRLEELKNTTELERETRAHEDLQARERRERGTEKKDSENQTSTIEINHVSCQTCQLKDIEQDEKSVQTTNMENEELLQSEKQLEELRVKFTELEANFILTQTQNRDDNQVQITTLTKDLDRASAEKLTVEQTLLETEEIRRKLEIQLTECHETHEPKILSLEKELAMSNDREITQSKHMRAQAEEIITMKNTFASQIKELEEKIEELTKRVDYCQAEKIELEQKLSENLKETEALEKRLQIADKRDQDKDMEIKQLQKSIKNCLSADMHEKKTQEEMKKNLKELLDAKEALVRTDELYNRLDKSSKQDIKHLEEKVAELEKKCELLESSLQQAQCENADLNRLRKEGDVLKIVINEKKREMAAFTANRDAMMKKYETLLKQHQEELEIARREVMRFQELFHKIPTTPRATTCSNEGDDQKNSIQIVDLANSDSKSTRRAAPLVPSIEAKRPGRKKKLYTPIHDSSIDLEVSNDVPPPTPSPATSTRSLRNRKK